MDPDAVGMVSGVGRGMGVLDGVVIVEGKGHFGGGFDASHCNQWGLCDAALPKLLWAVLVIGSVYHECFLKPGMSCSHRIVRMYCYLAVRHY